MCSTNSGKFRSIRKCTENGSFAIVEWDGNWLSFMDCLLQLALISEDTRSLYVPTSISQVIIDGPKHLTAVHDETGMVSVYLDKGSGTIRTDGIEVKGLGCSAIPRRKAGDPVLEISKFVPNVTSLNVQDAVRSLVQLVLENSNALKAKVVELLPENGPECSYLLCGGLGGFGLELADLLVVRGAKKLILTSRSGACNGYQRYRMRIWKTYGVKVITNTQDASTEEGCEQLLNLANNLGPVDGIFNLAAVLKDALFENHSRKLCPNLRYFVIFSSISCGRGNTGQINYGMVNSIMERVCEKRKRGGFPALAIQWGAIGELNSKFAGITSLKSVSMHATFPELGMNSMMAIEVKQTLEKEYEMSLTAQDIKRMTLSKLKDLASGGKSIAEVGTPVMQGELPVDIKFLLTYIGRDEFANITVRNLRTLVEDSEVAPHIVALAGIEGMSAILEPLCEKLYAHVPCLQYSSDVGSETLAELVERLLPHFETTTGDVIILGYSYGFVVATEVLYMLEVKGRTANVIFIDGSPELLCNMAKTYFPIDNENLSQTIFLSVVMARYMPYQEIVKHQGRLKQFKTYMEGIEYFLGVSPTLGTSTTFIMEMCVFGYNRVKSLMTYNIRKGKLKSNLTLFKAKVTLGLKAASDNGLSGICENHVHVFSIEGDHVTMLKNDDLAREINIILKNK